MSRFAETSKRRIISLPEICSYLNLVKYIIENDFIEKFIEVSNKSNQSFSKLIQKNGKLIKHELNYCNYDDKIYAEQEESTFISNTIEKLNRAKGAIGILHLDISNFFGSIYTHIIPAIFLGYEEAMKIFKKEEKENSDYKKLCELDMKIRGMNGNRTNGLLIGPTISMLIGECLLSRIDKEIESKEINFTRYVDDYEIYIYDEGDIERYIGIISNILNKYYLNLNNEKIKYDKFPYYQYDNFEKIIKIFSLKERDECELMELFNIFFEFEEKGSKGAIRYLIKSMNKIRIPKKEGGLYITYLLDILVNNERAFNKICNLLIIEKDNIKIQTNKEFKKVIFDLLERCVQSKKDLEVIWLLYLLKSLGINNFEERNIIKEKILKSENELAIIILFYEFDLTLEDKEKIIGTAHSWILLYQLYLEDLIEKDVFQERSKVKKNIHFYNKLKYNKFSFYKKI